MIQGSRRLLGSEVAVPRPKPKAQVQLSQDCFYCCVWWCTDGYDRLGARSIVSASCRIQPGYHALSSSNMMHFAGPLGHLWYRKLDQVASSCLPPSTASFVAAKVHRPQQPKPQQLTDAKSIACIVQVAADTFIYTPLNVGLFFAWITLVEGGGWTVGNTDSQLQLHLCAYVIADSTSSSCLYLHRKCATSFKRTFCQLWELRSPSGLLIRL